MPSRRSSKKDSPAKLASRIKRRWRVVLLRHKGEILGTVEAPDVASARACGVGSDLTACDFGETGREPPVGILVASLLSDTDAEPDLRDGLRNAGEALKGINR